MAKLRKGMRLVCLPCGREIVVDACGTSVQTVWCCGKPMARTKKSRRKNARKRAKK